MGCGQPAGQRESASACLPGDPFERHAHRIRGRLQDFRESGLYQHTMCPDVAASMHMRHRWRTDIPECLNHTIALFLRRQSRALIRVGFQSGLFVLSESSFDVGICDCQRRGEFFGEILLDVAALIRFRLHSLLNIMTDQIGNRAESSLQHALPHLLSQRLRSLQKLCNLLIDLDVPLIDGGLFL